MDSDERNEHLDNLLIAYDELKQEVRRQDKNLYERWKAGGFIIDSDIVSGYPNIEDIVGILNAAEEGTDCDEEDEEGEK